MTQPAEVALLVGEGTYVPVEKPSTASQPDLHCRRVCGRPSVSQPAVGMHLSVPRYLRRQEPELLELPIRLIAVAGL